MLTQSRLQLLQGGRSSEDSIATIPLWGLNVLELALSQCRELTRLQLEATAQFSQLMANVQVTSLDVIVGGQIGAIRVTSICLRNILNSMARTTGSSPRLVYSD